MPPSHAASQQPLCMCNVARCVLVLLLIRQRAGLALSSTGGVCTGGSAAAPRGCCVSVTDSPTSPRLLGAGGARPPHQHPRTPAHLHCCVRLSCSARIDTTTPRRSSGGPSALIGTDKPVSMRHRSGERCHIAGRWLLSSPGSRWGLPRASLCPRDGERQRWDTGHGEWGQDRARGQRVQHPPWGHPQGGHRAACPRPDLGTSPHGVPKPSSVSVLGTRVLPHAAPTKGFAFVLEMAVTVSSQGEMTGGDRRWQEVTGGVSMPRRALRVYGVAVPRVWSQPTRQHLADAMGHGWCGDVECFRVKTHRGTWPWQPVPTTGAAGTPGLHPWQETGGVTQPPLRLQTQGPSSSRHQGVTGTALVSPPDTAARAGHSIGGSSSGTRRPVPRDAQPCSGVPWGSHRPQLSLSPVRAGGGSWPVTGKVSARVSRGAGGRGAVAVWGPRWPL